MLRFTGWGLVALGAAGITVGLGCALPLVAGGLRGQAPAAGELALLGHALAWPVAAAGLVGLALVRLADGPQCRPAAWLVAAAVAAAVFGGVLAGIPAAIWQADAPRVAVLARAAVAGGWVLGVLGMLAMAVHRRAWPAPLPAALLATALHGVGSAAVELWLIAQDPLLITAQAGTFASPAIWLLGGAVLAEIAREVVHAPLGDEPPTGVDRIFLVLWSLLSVVTLVAGPGAVWPAAAALLLALVGVTAYAIDAGLSGSLRPRIEQPLGFLLVMLWSFGLLGVAALQLYGADVTLHDTYAELAPGHLLGPMLASVALLAGASGAIPEPRSRGPTAWLPWLGVAGCTVITGVALWRITSGFVALGLAGMPRRYFAYPQGTSSAWVDLGVGAALFGLGAAGTTLLVLVLAAWRARARARILAAERAEKAEREKAEAKRQIRRGR